MSFSSTSTVPIELLPGIGKRTAKVLRSLDIRTVGAFKSMPEKILIELFGPSIKPVHTYVHGKVQSKIQKTYTTPKQYNVHLNNRHFKKTSVSKKFKVAAMMLSFL
ncbi:MAG: hypothetical protein Q8P90_02125 [bacterium]|nr:hypothetical protein [bacterium]